LVIMALVGTVAAVVCGTLGAWDYAPLVGWDLAAATFTLWVWLAIGPLDADQTAAHARREDPDPAATDALTLAASVASLIAVGVVLVAASSAKGSKEWALAGLAAGSVALSWSLVHTLFTLRYARIYHARGGGVSFNQAEPPRYLDFAYLSFTIGMTFQVSDTNLESTAVRATALRQALLSYLFGAIILATTVNFIVSLAGSSSS
jgi:uncharacterized membrane protein